VKASFYSRFGKRWLDATASFIGLLVLLPVLFAAGLAIKFTSPGTVFFRQIRTGQFGKPFRIFKFRTMYATNDARAALVTSSGDPRITPIGRWLRASKIDELPQLINVLLGEMSLVGPRPEVPLYTDAYDQSQTPILQLKPGITSPATVALRNEEEIMALHTNEPEFYQDTLVPFKVATDLAYFQQFSLLGDLKLILVTFSRISTGSRLLFTSTSGGTEAR